MTNAKLEVSAELLAEMKEYLSYNPETGHFYWIKERKHIRRKVGEIADATNGKALYLSFNGKKRQSHRIAWVFYYGYLPKDMIDHKDGNPFNNKINNLREANNTQNQQNQRKPPKHNTSGFLGVSIRNKDKKFIRVVNKHHFVVFHTQSWATFAR